MLLKTKIHMINMTEAVLYEMHFTINYVVIKRCRKITPQRNSVHETLI